MFWKWKRAYCTLGKRTQGLRAGCDSGSSAYGKGASLDGVRIKTPG